MEPHNKQMQKKCVCDGKQIERGGFQEHVARQIRKKSENANKLSTN